MKYVFAKPSTVKRVVFFVNELERNQEFFHQVMDILVSGIASDSYEEVVHFLQNFENMADFKVANVPDIGNA